MENRNYLNKPGLLTYEDAKTPFVYETLWFKFSGCLDLSSGLKIESTYKYTPEDFCEYSQAISSFIAWWTRTIYQDLNGFSGFDTIKFEYIKK